ncbi:MAG: hypothetical protein QF662_02800 [Phycisphaerae bacterium]|nr:hypothetical protein [Phycisphaerae bacterium]
MPAFKSGKGLAPDWCELECFDIVELPKGASHTFERVGRVEKIIVGKGSCRIAFAGQAVDVEEGANLDLCTPDGLFEIIEALSDCTLIRMAGRWGAETGGSGIFTADNADERGDGGDPVAYPKTTNFDNHFHDCDEYWIIFEGRGVVVSEGRTFDVGPGDCVATGMGHHHDFPIVHEPVKAVFFETTMEGQGRPAHLWEHTHGPAEPIEERV